MKLNPRELLVTKYLNENKTPQEIAEIMQVSQHTIKAHLIRIKRMSQKVKIKESST